ncbi:hypothetical protein DWB79_02840 [Treponema medium]|uniref:Uncharacterized protein n=2 Tax=Treponema medium TaxID=58231 RepID=A0AA87NRZ1_TREMD|nr:hypothetical protein HMPREF9195_00562 [Treponema medium ATCC 700293]QSH96710.1 hypothetical protein DWB79_02840 [Treponema medium]
MSASYTASAWSIFWKGAEPKGRGKRIRSFFNNPAEKLILFDQNYQGWQWVLYSSDVLCRHKTRLQLLYMDVQQLKMVQMVSQSQFFRGFIYST